MGTRSLTHVKDERGATLVTIYRQFDGYPSGMGADLADFLKGRVVVNGIGSDTPAKASNGMGCLAASLVEELKEGIGNVYLYPPDTNDVGEEWTYTIRHEGEHGVRGQLWLTVVSYGGRPFYDGPVEAFDPNAPESED